MQVYKFHFYKHLRKKIQETAWEENSTVVEHSQRARLQQ